MRNSPAIPDLVDIWRKLGYLQEQFLKKKHQIGIFGGKVRLVFCVNPLRKRNVLQLY